MHALSMPYIKELGVYFVYDLSLLKHIIKIYVD